MPIENILKLFPDVIRVSARDNLEVVYSFNKKSELLQKESQLHEENKDKLKWPTFENTSFFSLKSIFECKAPLKNYLLYCLYLYEKEFESIIF
ncbi:hypothetical protein SteCoe_37361 [Stentor coeruleus]|uniref:Uncharacterized protein n=1 Tax=Stentor coeruleus TaxID=5963 RepID=A0A1R2AN64_9CILI|nr:hypothetical protein SteCoe_37361 [Stentor coeruleus]